MTTFPLSRSHFVGLYRKLSFLSLCSHARSSSSPDPHSSACESEMTLTSNSARKDLKRSEHIQGDVFRSCWEEGSRRHAQSPPTSSLIEYDSSFHYCRRNDNDGSSKAKQQSTNIMRTSLIHLPLLSSLVPLQFFDCLPRFLFFFIFLFLLLRCNS